MSLCEMKTFLGIDVGGTNLKYGITDANGRLLSSGSLPIEAATPAQLRSQCIELLKTLPETPAAIGIGLPGFIDRSKLILTQSPNLPGLNGMALETELLSQFPLPAFVENDANVAAWGEYSALESKPDSMVFLTLGSGIGSGLILNGKLWNGASGSGSEAGHIMIRSSGGRQCGCGRYGCAEAEFSITALLGKLREDYEPTDYAHLGPPDSISGRTLLTAALAEDNFASDLIKKESLYLGDLIGNLINAMNPQTVLLGGGMIAAADVFLPAVIQQAEKRAIAIHWETCEVRTGTLGNDAGIIGAALLAADRWT
jgi:glucokinase